MKIYTKTGDDGETSLFGGMRVPKDSASIEAYGTVDELNSHLGVVIAQDTGGMLRTPLRRLQELLFVLGADLASGNKQSPQQITEGHVSELEHEIDRLEEGLPPLTTFILPGGSPLGSQLHVARTVCRRAERLVASIGRTGPPRSLPLKFLNRLSDLLFVMARHANRAEGAAETPWKPL